MPRYAHLHTDLLCPFCGAVVTNLVWFRWGYCPSYSVRPDFLYRLDDPVLWMSDEDGAVPAWTYFRLEGFTHRSQRSVGIVVEANIGDPGVTDLIAQDEAHFNWREGAQWRRCGQCDHPLEGAVVEIRGGVLRRAWIYRPGEFDPTVGYYLIEAGERLKPVPKWGDHPMAVIQGGRRPASLHPGWGEEVWRAIRPRWSGSRCSVGAGQRGLRRPVRLA
jgi:hypothetical protein